MMSVNTELAGRQIVQCGLSLGGGISFGLPLDGTPQRPDAPLALERWGRNHNHGA